MSDDQTSTLKTREFVVRCAEMTCFVHATAAADALRRVFLSLKPESQTQAVLGEVTMVLDLDKCADLAEYVPTADLLATLGFVDAETLATPLEAPSKVLLGMPTAKTRH